MKKIVELELPTSGRSSYRIGLPAYFDRSDSPVVNNIQEFEKQTNPNNNQTYYNIWLSDNTVIEISALCATIITYENS